MPLLPIFIIPIAFALTCGIIASKISQDRQAMNVQEGRTVAYTLKAFDDRK
jgi:hypothetical protein